MSVDDKTLLAFADGELSGEEAAAVEAALAADPVLREKLEAHRRLSTQLSAAFDGALNEPVPTQLWEVAQTRAAEVVHLADRRAIKWSAREWGAMAASIAAGLLIGVGVMNTQAPMMAAANGGLQARGALAQALDTQLAADPPGRVRIGLSFVSQDGGYCRTFSLTSSDTSGLACRDGDAWTIAMTAQGGGGEVCMAAAPAAILAAVDAMIAGEPLDRMDEEQARARDWH